MYNADSNKSEFIVEKAEKFLSALLFCKKRVMKLIVYNTRQNLVYEKTHSRKIL